MTTITALTDGDHDDWLALWWGYLEFYEADLSPAQTELTFRRILDPEASIHGAIARDDAGSAIGIVHWLTHAATWSEGPYCYLEDLFVHPEVRGGGTGAALIENVRAWAHQHGCAKVYWLTQEHNRTARRLYDRVATDTGFVHYEIPLGG
ncbi:GNAT family N-acetyltransferase [Microbacterium pygmaeum]|uniref:Acetyltransferase (GNAT) family protein n=1 Tax=Microbacterium pygmaeum TaxID=370764 RepID=A0A1G7ZUU5_9MICO|nr:GNAT family N-acetyltransferase [Microbacterium pygmaeum]SDH12475.1 Acetyltransferase (GNAT) family protein [Microbacterium pygmaeum]